MFRNKSEGGEDGLLLVFFLFPFFINQSNFLFVRPKEIDSIRNSMNSIAEPPSYRRATAEKHLLPLGALSSSDQTDSSYAPLVL